jgi:hypothetical protein
LARGGARLSGVEAPPLPAGLEEPDHLVLAIGVLGRFLLVELDAEPGRVGRFEVAVGDP